MENRKVLLVDGSAQRRKKVLSLLTADPLVEYTCVELSSGQGAAQWLRTGSADCMLISSELPDESGFEVLGRSKDGSGRVVLPCVMLLPRADENLAQQVAAAGADEFLQETGLTGEALRLAIAGAISHRKTAGQLDERRHELA